MKFVTPAVCKVFENALDHPWLPSDSGSDIFDRVGSQREVRRVRPLQLGDVGSHFEGLDQAMARKGA